jgi:hypothetical protein
VTRDPLVAGCEAGRARLRLAAVLPFVVGLLVCVMGGDVAEADPPVPQAVRDAGVGGSTLEALASEYRRLRKIHGHMSGAPGHWVDEVDSAGGAKDRVMQELGRRFDRGTSRARVVALMGGPDSVLHSGDPGWETARQSRQSDAGVVDEALIYWWRGAHDYLIFDVDHGRVVGSHWYAALE